MTWLLICGCLLWVAICLLLLFAALANGRHYDR